MADAVNSLAETTAVSEACRHPGGPALLKAWLDRGGNPDAIARFGHTVINGNVYGGTLHTMIHGILFGGPSIEQMEMLRMLLEAGASVDLPMGHYGSNTERNWSPLHAAAMFHKYDIIKLLLDHGADINKRAPNGEFPLLHAVQYIRSHSSAQSIDAVRLLVSRGAKTDLRSWRVPMPGGWETPRTPEELMSLPVQPWNSAAYGECRTFLREVRLAGGHRRYVNAPRKSILVLRELCLRGRAAPPSELARLFVAAPAPTRRQTRTARRARGDDDRRLLGELPTPIFWHVMKFWQSERDYLPPHRNEGSAWRRLYA